MSAVGVNLVERFDPPIACNPGDEVMLHAQECPSCGGHAVTALVNKNFDAARSVACPCGSVKAFEVGA